MANKVYASPGVYTTEKDLTFTTETVGVTTLGVVGETLKGPAFQPIFVRNFDEYKTIFGGTSPEKFKNTQIVKYELPYIAKQYLTQSNQLYVTRLLGLSGYDSGMSWVVRTLGACDESTLSHTGITEQEFEFSFNTATNQFYVAGNVSLINHLSQLTGVNANEFDGAFNTFFTTIGGYTNAPFYDKKHAMYWGLLTNDIDTALVNDATSINIFTPSYVDAYELPVTVPANDRDAYVLNNELIYDSTTQTYSGPSFALFCHSFTGVNATVIKGTLKLYTVTLNCNPYTEGHNKTIATIKSRGGYVSDILKYNTASLGMIAPANLTSDPYVSFDLTGTTANPTGGTFSYTVSLNKTNSNYIKKVIGSTLTDKDSHIYAEEVYDQTLADGWYKGKIKGLYTELVGVNNWDHYKFQYQSPVTPFIVSELRGGVPQRLFRLISISDGTNANYEIKTSIANVDLSKKTFDIYIRSFSDTDKNPVIIERFVDCTMDETLDNYVGRKIGTIDNKYPLKSAYVVLEPAINAPKDAIPAGFEGYEFRTNGETDYTETAVPEMPYKTKYFAPGDVIYNPPFANPVISNGDKVNKNYLGFSSQFGFDKDLLLFKGKVSVLGDNAYNTGDDYVTKTKGFHMDINAQSIVDSLTNEQVFATGVASFNDATTVDGTATHPYNNMRTRKFTLLFAGGFDGWDEFRLNRTNTDEYKIGRTGFVASQFDTFTNVEYAELFGTSDYYAYLYGIRTYQNPEETPINILATPGIDVLNNTDLVRDAIEVVEEKRLDAIYLPTLPDIKLLNNNNPSDTESWYYAEDIVDELENTEIDSNYTAVYYPWIQITDTENNANLFIPPTAEVVRNMAYTDNVAFPWFATAGYNRGLVKCNRARIVLDQEARDILYPGRINPLATYSDVGVVIWGNRNLQVRSSALDRLNIRRLLLQARRLIMSVSKRLLFDPNDTTVRNQFLSLVNPILDNIRKERGLTDFRVSVAMDVEDNDRNTLRGKIFIKPTPTLEFIELEFVVTPQNVSFDNI